MESNYGTLVASFLARKNRGGRDERLNREMFDTLLEASVVIERWRREYNRYRPQSSLEYKPPAPEAFEVKNLTLQLVY
ncbi:MAG: transposase [Candidatus Aminicenantes bacterium]|nr:transposase [Candidatus Aminicenantes bacterium]MDH5384147.1 transposase [Candidatus Aminicenantes bacterium]MDH5742521.1 transposase [Candidatus Aminicenantes bacterium]